MKRPLLFRASVSLSGKSGIILSHVDSMSYRRRSAEEIRECGFDLPAGLWRTFAFTMIIGLLCSRSAVAAGELRVPSEPAQGNPQASNSGVPRVEGSEVEAVSPQNRPSVDETTEEEPFSEWLPRTQHQALFDAQSRQGRYPVKVEARNAEGAFLFRAQFVPRPNDRHFAFRSFHGINLAEYRRRTANFERNGFRELSVTSIVDASGVEQLSGTWVRETADKNAKTAPTRQKGATIKDDEPPELKETYRQRHIMTKDGELKPIKVPVYTQDPRQPDFDRSRFRKKPVFNPPRSSRKHNNIGGELCLVVPIFILLVVLVAAIMSNKKGRGGGWVGGGCGGGDGGCGGGCGGGGCGGCGGG